MGPRPCVNKNRTLGLHRPGAVTLARDRATGEGAASAVVQLTVEAGHGLASGTGDDPVAEGPDPYRRRFGGQRRSP